MNFKSFNGQNLRNARLYQRMTINELASKINVTKQTISLYENRNVMPDFEKIINISHVLDFPYEFFFQKHTFNYTPTTTYFKSLSSTTKLNRISHSLRLNYISKIHEALCEFVDFPKLNILQYNNINNNNINNYTEIEYYAKSIRELWNIGNEPINNLKYILEKNGIIVTYFTDNNNNIGTFSQKSIDTENTFFISLYLYTPLVIVNFDLAHELGHILLHSWDSNLEITFDEDFELMEKQANLFADSFLLPRDSFIKDIKNYPTNLEHYKLLKNKWNVSIQNMIRRAYQLDVITFNQHQYLMIEVYKYETENIIYKSRSLFQEAIDLLISGNVLSEKEIVDLVYRNGVIMSIDNLENLLTLNQRTLTTKEIPKNIITLKNKL